MKSLLGVGLLVVIMASGAVAAGQEKPLDNAEVVKLSRLEMGDAVIIAKIKSATVVRFATEVDDLVKLKEAGVSNAVIAALIDRSSARPTALGVLPATAGAIVMLNSSTGAVGLTSVEGAFNTVVAPFVGMKRFFRFPELAASARTTDVKPWVTIEANQDPRTAYWLVRLDPDDDEDEMNRSLDIQSPGMFGGAISSAPDGDQLIKCEQVEEKPGVWRYTPLKDLKPGEYGIYFGRGDSSGIVYSFGVDKKRVP